MKRTARISDLFVSYQGEGLYCGEKQIFVRFYGCNLNCDYCDEFHSQCERRVSKSALLKEVLNLSRESKTRVVSITGGEPLMQTDFLKEFLPLLKSRGFKILLETNAVLPNKFAEVRDFTDIISADIKLPSATGRNLWRRIERFLSSVPDGSYVKIVVTSKTRSEEIEKAFGLLKSLKKQIPIFIQPATRFMKVRPPKMAFFRSLMRLAENYKIEYEILPQQHVLWGVK